MVKGDRIHLVDFSFICIFNKEDNYMSACSVSYTPNLSDIGSIPEGSKCFPFRVGPFSCFSHSWKLLKGISLDFSQMQRIVLGFVAEDKEGRRRICFISFCLGIFVTHFLFGDICYILLAWGYFLHFLLENICYILFAWGYLLHTFCLGIFVTYFLLGDICYILLAWGYFLHFLLENICYILFAWGYLLHTFCLGIFLTHFLLGDIYYTLFTRRYL